MPDQFILYACPVGELATQLETYFDQSQALCGRNAAHHYMPHCTLTGFFKDEESAIPLYLEAIAQTLAHSPVPPLPVMTILSLSFRADWHGLELQSEWLPSLVAQVAQQVRSPSRREALRLKHWLHLSLAYEFPPDQAETLMQLAQTYINPQAAVEWELRFYQRHADHRWTCHQSWLLSTAEPVIC